MKLAYWTYEGTAHFGVARIANSLRGAHAVFHAPQGDGYVTPIFAMLERAPALPQMTTSVVQGRDLAVGSIRLPETLRQVENEVRPELIIVSASCSTTLLQEDLEMTARSAGLQTPVVVFDGNPFRLQEHVAAERLLTVLVRRFARPQPLTPAPSVNLIGPASLGFHVRPDLIALRRMMQALGVAVNVVAPLGASVEDLRRLPAAWVNVAPYRELGQEAAAYLGAAFGTPALTTTPVGVQATLRWLDELLALLNQVGAGLGAAPLTRPPLTAFSLDGQSAPSGVPWFARTADLDSFSSKRVFLFGDATRTVAVAKFLHDELDMQIAGAGTYLPAQAEWMAAQLAGYLHDDLLVTTRFQEVTARIEALMPDLVCGTQMERHSCRKLDVPVMVIAPPTHIENHLLGYTPILGFAGADYLADTVMTSTKLGLEKHLIDLFGDAGLDYSDSAPARTAQGDALAPAVAQGVVEAVAEESAARPALSPVPTPPAAPRPALTAENIPWTPGAEKLLQKIPFFVRGRVRKRTAQFALDHGHDTVSEEVLHAAREAFGG